MTIDEFVAALAGLRERYIWYIDDMGALRAFLPEPISEEHSPMTALAYAQTGKLWEYTVDWEHAGIALGLSFEDSVRLVSSEDNDREAEAWLARALREAVVVAPAPAPAVPRGMPPAGSA